MPIAERGPTLRTAVSSPWRTSFHRWSTSQNRRSPSLVGTGTTLFEKRRISVRERRPSAMVPTMTRPEEAPRSTAPMWTGVASDMREPFGCWCQEWIREGAGTGRVGQGLRLPAPLRIRQGLRPPNLRRCLRRAPSGRVRGTRNRGRPASDRGPVPGTLAARRASVARRC